MAHPNSPVNGLVTSKDWTLERLLEFGPRFRPVDRISSNSMTPEQVASTVKDYEQRNLPLIVQDLHIHPDWPEFFTPQWLETHYGSQSACVPILSVESSNTDLPFLVVEVRNLHGERLDRELTITELIDNLRTAPRFAQQGGMVYSPCICTFSQLSARTRTLVRQGCVLPNRVEKLDQDGWSSARCDYTGSDWRYSSGDRGNLDELHGSL